jgi:hypothetical protein
MLASWADPRESDNPDILCRSIELVLAHYPLDIQEIIANPACQRLGEIRAAARSHGEYLPFVEAVRRACEDLYGPTRRRMEREANITKQLAERTDYERKLEGKPKQIYAEFKAEMEARGMPIDGRENHGETAGKVMTRLGISQEQWDAIPDLPVGHEDESRERWDRRSG